MIEGLCAQIHDAVWGFLECARDFRARSAAKEQTNEVQFGGFDPGVSGPGAGPGQSPAHSKFSLAQCTCFHARKSFRMVVIPGRRIFLVAGFARLRRRSAASSGASVRNQTTTGAAYAPRPLALLPRAAPPQGPPLARSVAPGRCIFLLAGVARLRRRSRIGRHQSHYTAVIGQTSMNLGNSDVMVRNRDKTSRKDSDEDDAFAKILAGKRPPENHPFARLNKTAQYETALFKHDRVFMQIWFHQSMNQPCKDKGGDTLDDFKWQDFLSRMEISVHREHFLTHGLKNTGNKSINGVIRGFQESRNRHRLLDGRDLYQGIQQPSWRRSIQGRNQQDRRLIADNQEF